MNEVPLYYKLECYQLFNIHQNLRVPNVQTNLQVHIPFVLFVVIYILIININSDKM